MRTIKELLILLREKLPEYINREFCGSLCCIIHELRKDGIITKMEYGLLQEYIDECEPDNAENYCVENVFGNEAWGFWWPYGELAPRLEFLDKLIAEL